MTMLTPDRWRLVHELFSNAVTRPAADRARFLDERCSGDPELRAEVESLLAADAVSSDDTSLAGGLVVDWSASQRLDGVTVDHYRVIEWLGAGGMGEVYVAEDTTLGRRVAIKVLPAASARDASRLRRFTDEARAASALNHPNIVTVYGVGDLNGRPYIASELVEGETLRTRLAGGPLPAADALGVAIQLAGALAAAHQAGIVHRDLKPENVMIRPDGYVKLLDFGVAKLIATDGVRRGGVTASGAAIGTLDYMAPEQASGASVDGRADLYALCVVLFEMLTGALPRELGSGSDETGRTMPLAMVRAIRRGLATDPAARYQSAAELGDALRVLQRVSVRSTPRLVAAALTTVLIIGAPAMWLWLGRSPASTGPVDLKRVQALAVLPFQTINLAGEDAYLGLGLADAVISQVGASSRIAVRPTDSVREYTQPGADSVEIGRRLGVEHVLTGLVQQAGDRVRVTAQLVDVRSGATRWSARVDAAKTNLFELQDAVAQKIVTTLLEDATEAERGQVVAPRAANPEAHELYLRGRYFLSRNTRADVERSLALFQQAVALDPRYALAHAGVAAAYQRQGAGFIAAASPFTVAPLAKEAAERALRLDASLAEALYVIGYVQFQFEYDFPAAGKSFARAVELRPASAEIRRVYGWYLYAMGRHAEGIAQLRQARELDPTDALIAESLGLALEGAGQTQDALRELDDAVKLAPNSARAAGRSIGILERLQRYDEVMAIRTRLARAGGRAADAARMEAAYRAGGYRAVLEDDARTATNCVQAARVNLLLERRDEAITHLHRCVDERYSWTPILNVDPTFAALHAEPRFGELMRRIGLQ